MPVRNVTTVNSVSNFYKHGEINHSSIGRQSADCNLSYKKKIKTWLSGLHLFPPNPNLDIDRVTPTTHAKHTLSDTWPYAAIVPIPGHAEMCLTWYEQ